MTSIIEQFISKYNIQIDKDFYDKYGLVLIDCPKNGFSHMVSDYIPNLHIFAEYIGIKKCWYENKKGKYRPHYDVNANLFDKSLTSGAILVDSRVIVEFLKIIYEKKK